MNYFLIIFLIIFSACSGKITGKYYIKDASPNDYEMNLRKNHTFKLRVWSDVMGETVEQGIWENKGDSLFLEVIEPDIKSFISFKSLYSDTLKGSMVQSVLKEFSFDPPYLADVKINNMLTSKEQEVGNYYKEEPRDTTIYYTLKDSIFYVNKIQYFNHGEIKIKSVEFIFWGQKFTQKIRKKANILIVYCDIMNIPRIRQNIEKKWIIKGNTLSDGSSIYHKK